ncbi:MAG TPA: hypothetical protein VF574_12680 [Allosphingosinicella sp.]|jgi:hypothetical protein
MTASAVPAGATDIDPYWLSEVPSEYLGRWNVNAKACTPFDGRQRLVIEPNRLGVGGDLFRISYVGWSQEGGIVISSEYAGTAKPSWKRTDFFRIEKGGQVLLAGAITRPTRRVRCR